MRMSEIVLQHVKKLENEIQLRKKKTDLGFRHEK